MSDNTTINPGAGGAVIATDDIGGVQHQRMKVGYGADGSYTDVSATSPMPTTVAAFATMGTGRASVATAGTRVQLSSSACSSVTVKARATNVNTIYIGGSGVTAATGFELAPGETVSIDVTNTNMIYIDAATATDGVAYIWVA